MACTVPAVLVLLASGGCNDHSSKVSVSTTELTPIANCVVDSENDVAIGGPNAPEGCQDVGMDPSSAGPASFDEIVIASGGTLHIQGSALKVSSRRQATSETSIPLVTLEKPVQEICIEDGGTLEYGTPDKPITSDHKIVMRFIGNKDAVSPKSACKDFRKGIDVLEGGTLRMYGAKGVPQNGGVSWTTLASPAGTQVPGAKVKSTGTQTLELTADVTKGPEGWQRGDWIVVGTTSYSPYDTEFVRIASVKSNPNGGSTVTLMDPLRHYHFGSPAPSKGTCTDRLRKEEPASFCDGATRNYGVDERAEVGLISRDIELRGTVPDAGDNRHWGGEIMIHAGFKDVRIQGVRLSQFGKDQLGSYPIHFHMVGNAHDEPLVNADSVDHSYNKCVTIHNTSHLTIQNMVCARIVGHIFYEELDKTAQADDGNLTFDHDLGLGAMSNDFDIYSVKLPDGTELSRQDLIDEYWWTGDYMTNDPGSPDYIGYNGFNVPDTDNWHQPTHGSCTKYGPDGSLIGYLPPDENSDQAACPPKPPLDQSATTYIEPASGFWIQNPNTKLVDNAIGGCQGVGRGFWWVTPNKKIDVNGNKIDLKFQPLGTFKDNRAHACYAGFYGENEYSVQSTETLFPHKDGKQDAPAVIATLDGMTATRNRFRGVWLRPTWFVIKNGRFASNRESVSLVTSGGIDGNAPGVWDLLEDSVVVGFSQNNVDRWGPCPTDNELGPNTGGHFGCVDHTPPPSITTPHSGAEVGLGYTPPSWNDFGYMLYDGPVRVFHDRFVNFNYNNPNGTDQEFSNELDTADSEFLAEYVQTHASKTGEGPPAPYEGDAALGWFQSNQSAYPTGTASKQLMWDNTNLRHQIYTKTVSLSHDFNDGDKNTAIIDEDGTLSGLGVQIAPGTGTHPVHAISLNNLPFNATSNSVDECLSRGAQNELYEGRDSSLMSPAEMGTLEFSNLYPFYNSLNNLNPPASDYPGTIASSHWQNMIFTRDDRVPDGKGGMFRPSMTMQTGRNGLGIWEPKVTNGFGYTVRVARTTAPAAPQQVKDGGKAGIWKWIEVGLADVVDPNIGPNHPFYVRLGINYTNKDGTHPANKFTIERGYKSYRGGNTWIQDPALTPYWTYWADCENLDANNNNNVPYAQNNNQAGCPGHDTAHPLKTLTKVGNISGLTNSDGTPNLDVYYYNSSTGYLYLNVAQDEPNPVGPSPLGSCAIRYDGGSPDASCPDTKKGESYYACPKNGCIIYAIAQDDPNYDPGPSQGQPEQADLKPAPTEQNKLVKYGTSTVINYQTQLDKQDVPYNTATNGPVCKATQPPLQ